MRNFFNLLASGTRSLSFTPTMEMPEFEHEEHKGHKEYIRRIELRKPRTPQEIMREAWEDVGNRMWEAIGLVEKEYGKPPR